MENTTQEIQAVEAVVAPETAEAVQSAELAASEAIAQDEFYAQDEDIVAPEVQPTVAVIGEIVSLSAIDGADRILLAVVDCGEHGTWSGVVPKEGSEAEARYLVLLQDALLPPGDERWAFMSKHKFRVRMARFKGVPSECVILPATADEIDMGLGADVGAKLGITKYSKPLPTEMAGRAKGNFPGFIVKTDEPNFQRVRGRHEIMAAGWIATVKYDGTSGTSFVRDDVLRVCSRNLELENDGNLYFRMAEKYQLQRVPEGLALQFEIIGPGVQGNPLDLAENEIRAFTLYDIANQCKAPAAHLEGLCRSLGIPQAEVVYRGNGTVGDDDLRKLAEIRYPNGRHGEGIVIRDEQHAGSMKVINLLYKEA